MEPMMLTMEKADVQRLIWWLGNVDGAYAKFYVNSSSQPVVRVEYDLVIRECKTFASAVQFLGLQKKDVSNLPDVDMDDIEWMVRWIAAPNLHSIECTQKGGTCKILRGQIQWESGD